MKELKTLSYVVSCWVLIGGAVAAAGAETSPAEVFKQMEAAYAALDVYQSEGTIVATIDTGGISMKTETSFSIRLKKPNLYRITWTQKNQAMPGVDQSGAVWSDGTQPYLYMGTLNAYSKMQSDEIAIGGATGISGGAAMTIPSLFLAGFEAYGSAASRLKDPTIERTETVAGDLCYVVSGASTISKKETLWISTTRHLIRKHQRSLEPPDGGIEVPEMTDEQIDASIEGMGQEVNDEARKNMRAMIRNSQAMMKTMKMQGLSTEIHSTISTPELRVEDFTFSPEGATLKDSLFGDMFGGS